MKYRCALITVEDMDKSRFLYETLLGQTVNEDYEQNISFHGGFAIHLKSHFKTLIGNKPIGSSANNFELYFEEDNIEPIVETLKENNITFVHEIREQPWRQKVIRFYDYDGHIIEIGERLEHTAYRLHLEGLPVEKICKTTYLSEAAVGQAIREHSK